MSEIPAEDDVAVSHAPERTRFEITVAGVPAGFTEYRVTQEGYYSFFHTEIDPGIGRRGLGSRLVGEAMAAMAEQGIAVLPRCPFVRAYLLKHPELLDLVPTGSRADFGLPQAEA